MLLDIQVAINIAKNPAHHDRSKHIQIGIPTRLQIIDILTKALPRTSFEEFSSKLGLYNITTQLEGECRKELILIQ